MPFAQALHTTISQVHIKARLFLPFDLNKSHAGLQVDRTVCLTSKHVYETRVEIFMKDFSIR